MNKSLVELLQSEMRLDERSILKLIATAPKRYKTFQIRKKNGKFREIAQPASELKIAQKIIVSEYLSKLPVHPAAMAYKEGTSIVDNVLPHANVNGPILKLDFENFFPSITEQAWLSYCQRHGIMDRRDSIQSGRLLFRQPVGGKILRLSIGAPSSPILSNILLFDFDSEVSRRLDGHKIEYTRYADDLTFSASRTGNLLMVEKTIRSVLSTMTSPKLKLNEEKTLFITKKYRRNVTGIIIADDGRLSVGREKRRLIRAALHRFSMDGLSDQEAAVLSGYFSFLNQVEPNFCEKMVERYGGSTIERLKAQGRSFRRPVNWTSRRTARALFGPAALRIP